MKTRRRLDFYRLPALVLVLVPATAFALPGEFASPTLDAFNNVISQDVVAFVLDEENEIHRFGWMLWRVFSVGLVVATAVKYAAGRAGGVDALVTMLMIGGVAGILNYYDQMTRAVWSFSDLGMAYQAYSIGHADDPMWPAKVLADVLSRITIADVTIFGPIQIIVWATLYSLISLILTGLFYISSCWSIFGYALAKVIGFIFIPLAMIPWTRGFFEGWVKLFMGFVMYNMLARVVMVLLVRYYQATLDIGSVQMLDIQSQFDQFIAVICMQAVGVLFLLSTAGFAAILAGGFTSMSSAANALMRVVKLR